MSLRNKSVVLICDALYWKTDHHQRQRFTPARAETSFCGSTLFLCCVDVRSNARASRMSVARSQTDRPNGGSL